MKRLTLLLVIAVGAAAQPVKVKSYLPVSVMGKAVKGAPYAADEITESVQVLSDGTRITNHSQVTVYRDGEGRVRRESPTQITIWDPVANVSYTLDPKAMTAVKSSMARPFGVQTNPTNVFYFSKSDSTSEAAGKAASEALDKLKAEAEARSVIVNGTPADAQTAASMKEQLALVQQKLAKLAKEMPSRSELLGQQVMQGLTADGTRETSTIEAGVIGNDRPSGFPGLFSL